uniref:Neural cell adhesion molecule L1 n=1 Tax=Cyprinus carpio TaxID=7962 RepID=A0A8C2HCX7_CYPCA
MTYLFLICFIGRFRWVKDGVEFDPSKDPELSVSRDSGTFSLTAKDGPIHQYQGRYNCYASNVLGTAVSNEARIVTENTPTLQKEKKVSKKVEEGESVVLPCNPPNSTVAPVIHWMDKKLRHIQQNERVIQGRDGNLYFSHVTEADSRDDYTCNTQFPSARIIVLKANSVVRNRRPQMMRPTGPSSSYLVLSGQNLDLECIAQGLPSPKIQWIRKDGVLSESRTSKDSYDRVLRFKNISVSDSGEYQCTATNLQGIITHTYSVTVEAAPYWTKEPKSQLYSPGETVKLECKADGIPSPEVTWSINGNLLTDIDPDPRRSVKHGVLTLKNVELSDTAVYQCKANCRNEIHFLVSNILYLVFLELPPQILTEDGVMYSVAEGQMIELACETFGSPRQVRFYTFISLRMYMIDESTLIIPDVKEEDEGTYTCEVITTLDIAEASGSITVVDRPDPPTQIQMTEPKERSVTLSWTPGDDHNSPVLEYLIEFEETEYERKEWEELSRVSGNRQRTTLSLKPFLSYRFRVIAINDIGKSDPSMYTDVISTPAAPPDSNPEGVRSDSIDPGTLLITWKEMDRRSFNGPGFEYKVMWRKVLGSGPSWHIKSIKSPPLIITDVGNFSAFEIKVQAVNEMGEGPEPKSTIGYSGEDYPLEAPLNVGVDLISSTAIKVVWAPIKRETVRGRLQGYKVIYCAGKPSNISFVMTDSNEEMKVLGDLLPYSHYALSVSVINNKGEGPQSDPLTFHTPEGVPGPPSSLLLDSPSETEMILHWTPPSQPNGILKGYILRYQQGNIDHGVSHVSLKLDPHSRYRFYLRGYTSLGEGLPIIREGATTLDGGFVTESWFIGLISALVLLLLVLLILCFIKRSKGGKYSVKEKEEGQIDSEARPMNNEGFGEYSDNEEKRTASQPSLCEDSKLCTDDALDDYANSNSVQTEVIMDESLASQSSGVRDVPDPGTQESSPLNPATAISHHGLPNSAALLD